MRSFPLLAVLVAGVCALIGGARAERLVIQRGDALFVTARDGSDIRKVITIGSAPGTLWAVSPDGRRFAWLTRPAGEGDLDARPATLMLNDITGRRFKKLAVTDALRDRLGRPVVALSPAHVSEQPSALKKWAPVSLSWSADSKTVYIGFGADDGALVTVAIDGARGAALVDAEARWKSLAPVAQADARGAQMAAVQTPSAGGGAALALINLADGSLTTIASTEDADYASAAWPALAPDGQSVAFATLGRGLFLCEGAAHTLRRLVLSDSVRPRWSETGKSILFLAPRPSTGEKVTYDLFELTLGGNEPKLVLQNLDWFDVVPD